MNKMYIRSIKMMRKLKKAPSSKEWNVLARKYGLMHSLTLQYLMNMSLKDIFIEIKNK